MFYVIGDIHGHYERLVHLLKNKKLVDEKLNWLSEMPLWFVGDLTDRGPNGIKIIDLIIKWQKEAPGSVNCLLGNHDLLILAAKIFGNQRILEEDFSFFDIWLHNGGQMSDLDSLNTNHIEWIMQRPAVAKVGHTLLLHSDTTNYQFFGENIEKINSNVAEVLRSNNIVAFNELERELADRKRFFSSPENRIREFLDHFSCQRLVHGHTPIANLLKQDPKTVTQSFEYANGLCLNVDHGLYLGGPGFITKIA